MNIAGWFMVVQCLSCFAGAIGFAVVKQWWVAWIWLCYGLANIGFVMLALRTKGVS